MSFQNFAILTTLAATWLSGFSLAQSSVNCPFLGPIFPAPDTVLRQSTAVPSALNSLRDTIQSSLLDNVIDGTNVSFYVSVFSKNDTLLDFAHNAPSLNSSLTSGTLNEDTIFRIGSVSKLITVYTILSEVGMKFMNDPVTNWVPELAMAANQTRDSSPVAYVRWEEVTLGALASQLAGISRDSTLGDMSVIQLLRNTTWPQEHGISMIPQSRVPTCGIAAGFPPCSRDVFFSGLDALHPVTSSFNTPIYSNIAYQILAYAVEGITGQSFSALFQSSMVDQLGLKRTSLEMPPTNDNAIIPDNELLSWWNYSMQDASPYGGMYSTPSDLRTIGQSILNNTLLAPSLRRAWLKPTTHTADLRVSVGMPWEIRRMLVPVPTGSMSSPSSPSGNNDTNNNSMNTRAIDLYTKNGALGSYASLLALSPDHDFGFVILTASSAAATAGGLGTAAMAQLGDIVSGVLVPAFEEAAREQVARQFGGTYRFRGGDVVVQGGEGGLHGNPDRHGGGEWGRGEEEVEEEEEEEEGGMWLTLTAGDGRPGLGVYNWTMKRSDGEGGEMDVLATYAALKGITQRPSLRLYPMDLEGALDRGTRRLAFRGVYEVERPLDEVEENNQGANAGLFTSGCLAWGAVDSPMYGGVGLDDFVFEVDDELDEAVAVVPRVAGRKLVKVA